MKYYLHILLILSFYGLLTPNRSSAQVCSSPSGTIYSLSFSGSIYPMNVNTGALGSAINVPYGSPNQADAMGYNGLNGKFYYFNASVSPLQFISFNPVLNSYAVLAACPATTQVVSACITPDGLGYYCRDQNATIYYYNIVGNTWTTITSTYLNPSGTNITATVQGLATGGDMAFDASGNLFFVFSNSSNYAVYELVASVPTTAVASITIKQILGSTATPDGSIIAGMSFSYTGQMYMTTLNNNLYILNNNLTTTLKGSFSSFAGVDLTSCNFPPSVLPVNFIEFKASASANNTVDLNWTVAQQTNVDRYEIQQSSDGVQWQTIGKVSSNNIQGVQSYYFKTNASGQSKYFYRISEVETDGKAYYSETRLVSFSNNTAISLWPNPAADVIQVQNSSTQPLKAQLFDPLGRDIKEMVIQPGTNHMDISSLHAGSYVLMIREQNTNLKFIKE